MHKKIFFTISALSSVLLKASTYTMYAGNIEAIGDKVYAQNSVVIYYKQNMYRAKEAVYDRKKKLIILKGDVVAISKNTTTKSETLQLNLSNKKSGSDKFFIYNSTENIWIRGSKYSGKNGIYIVKNSEVSSCDTKNPDWKITFKKAKYNKNIEFLTLTKPVFYFKNKAIFALPWFAFPTVKDRKTGLLRPIFGVKVESGFVYMQPYFYAPYKNWDILITPQIRTSRGAGVYTTLSFADTKYSSGSITIGSFHDKKSFVDKKNLKNSSHYGFDIKYKSNRVFKTLLKSDKYKDGLWIDLHYLNDIDYENLKDINIKSLNKLVTSRFNYFYKRDIDYIGIYAKYFIDTDKNSNDDTLQELPSIQYHRFITNLPLKNLIYSVDYKVTKNYRKEGLNATLHEINLPLKLNFSLLNEYVNFSISENLYYNKIDYSKKTYSDIKDAYYFSNYHKFVLSSDLIKPYKNFLHNIQLEASLQVPSFENKSGYIADFITINKEEKNFKFSINQYFYNLEDFNFLTLRTNQTLYLDRDNKYSDIYNEIIYKYSKELSISENIEYSTLYKKIKRVQTSIDFDNEVLKLSLSHTYENIPSKKKVNYLTSDLKIKLDNGYEFEADINYDIENSLTKSWSMKLFRDKKCWNYSIKYKESVTPIFTSAGVESYKSRGLYFLVNFANIGGISYEYAKEDVTSGERL